MIWIIQEVAKKLKTKKTDEILNQSEFIIDFVNSLFLN